MQAKSEEAYPEPAGNFQEGQWWIQELDRHVGALPTVPENFDVKRAVAVVHHMLKSLAATPQVEPGWQQLLRQCYGRIVNLSRSPAPGTDPLDGPVLRAIEIALHRHLATPQVELSDEWIDALAVEHVMVQKNLEHRDFARAVLAASRGTKP